ncbi:MAG: efflux RND transporter periplasmic adaptor subunit [Flavobacteriales bacterium]|nr:efflux RND transporter periplasmic adaptor subunit [Flavobacteriales bacterium]
MKNKYFSVAVVLVLALHSCSEKQTNETSPEVIAVESTTIQLTEAQIAQAGIHLIQPVPGSIPATIKLNGTTQSAPMNQVQVCAPLGGFLKSTTLTPGQFVQQGQVIAMLEDQQFIQIQEEYLKQKAQLALSDAEYERQNQLNKTKSSSDKVLEMARTEYVTRKISFKALEEKLKLIGVDPSKLNEDNISRSLPLKAPISGFTSDLNAKIGQYINPTDVILSITNNEQPYLILKAFEKDIAYLSVGQKVLAISSAFPGKTLECKIETIGRELDSDRSISVVCAFVSAPVDIRPGEYFTGETEIRLNDGLLVPSESVVNFENRNFVFITSSPGEFIMTEVELVSEHDQESAIKFANAIAIDSLKIAGPGAYSILMKLKNSEE